MIVEKSTAAVCLLAAVLWLSPRVLWAGEPSDEGNSLGNSPSESAPAATSDETPVTPPAASGQGMEKSPLFAMLRSAVLPGWGQLYTEHPFRGGLIFTVEGFLVTLASVEERKADRAWEIYSQTGDLHHLSEYNGHHDRGRGFFNLAIAGYLLNIADAYVDAQLYGFEGNVSFDRAGERLVLGVDWRYR
jgi:hypothetical protein